MTLEPMLRAIAGTFVAASVLLGIYVSAIGRANTQVDSGSIVPDSPHLPGVSAAKPRFLGPFPLINRTIPRSVLGASFAKADDRDVRAATLRLHRRVCPRRCSRCIADV